MVQDVDYAGNVSPEAAFAALSDNSAARLVDVRTQPEWGFVGQVDPDALAGPTINLSWQDYPHMAVNGAFADTLKSALGESGATPSDPVYFLCRSGVRSLAAAREMAAHGFTACFNIEGGFEGDKDDDGHRGRRNGWKVAKLPWKQG